MNSLSEVDKLTVLEFIIKNMTEVITSPDFRYHSGLCSFLYREANNLKHVVEYFYTAKSYIEEVLQSSFETYGINVVGRIVEGGKLGCVYPIPADNEVTDDAEYALYQRMDEYNAFCSIYSGVYGAYRLHLAWYIREEAKKRIGELGWGMQDMAASTHVGKTFKLKFPCNRD